jgi:methylthioribulose-1-phosphate dehydratase
MTTASQYHSDANREGEDFDHLSALLGDIGRNFDRRGWVLGTSGNFSAVTNLDPLRLAITASGADKSALAPGQFVEIDGSGKALRGDGRPSAETRLHLTLVRVRGARAVLHTHSVWGTMLSQAFVSDGGLAIEGYEMLKGLEGVDTHEHREWLPIIDNSQDYEGLDASLERTLEQNPVAHGFLLRQHGLYTWGKDLNTAKRHTEILEFLVEVIGRTYLGGRRLP